MRAGYAVLVALLALVLCSLYDSRQENPAETLSLFSGRNIFIISILCFAIGGIAGGAAVFFVGRAFYLAFTRPEARQKDNDDA